MPEIVPTPGDRTLANSVLLNLPFTAWNEFLVDRLILNIAAYREQCVTEALHQREDELKRLNQELSNLQLQQALDNPRPKKPQHTAPPAKPQAQAPKKKRRR